MRIYLIITCYAMYNETTSKSHLILENMGYSIATGLMLVAK